MTKSPTHSSTPILVTAGTGKTGRRVARLLADSGHNVRVVKAAGVPWTIVRASLFSQIFGEDCLLGSVLSGTIDLPAPDISEPFVDTKYIVRALIIATRRPISYVSVSTADYTPGAIAKGVPTGFAHQFGELFSTGLDGRTAHLGTGVFDALERIPKSFDDYARVTAATGIWNVQPETNRR